MVSAVYPGTDMANLPVLGTITSHGFLGSGFLPIRVAFPVVAAILLGPSTEVPDTVIMDHLLITLVHTRGESSGRLSR